ncbi:MAG: hypothetical protein K6G37_02620 [Bacilli bacterium]|nr:hypothetical protein [Bacilli bacterium]
MKKEDGFVAISIIYSVFILFIMIMIAIMFSYISDRKTSNRIKNDIRNEFNTRIPHISISKNGSDYPSSSYTVKILVSPSPYGIKSIKYIWSKDPKAIPNTSISNPAEVTTPNDTGKYYLIVKACDNNNACQTLISKKFILQ